METNPEKCSHIFFVFFFNSSRAKFQGQGQFPSKLQLLESSKTCKFLQELHCGGSAILRSTSGTMSKTNDTTRYYKTVRGNKSGTTIYYKALRGNIPARTRRPRDVPCPSKVLMSGTCRGSLRDSQVTNTKIDDLMKKMFSRSNSACITYLFLLFSGRTNIQKF